jgi:hypothetical protein
MIRVGLGRVVLITLDRRSVGLGGGFHIILSLDNLILFISCPGTRVPSPPSHLQPAGVSNASASNHQP